MRSSPGTPASVISAPVTGSTIRASVVRDMVIDQAASIRASSAMTPSGRLAPNAPTHRCDPICGRSPAISAAAGRWPIRLAVRNAWTWATPDRWVSS
jgi:hypothetical protein